MLSSASSVTGRRIVVVTAAADLRGALRFLLQVEGYEVDGLDSGEALLASALDPSDCLLVDHDLPGVSGLDALGMLRNRRRGSAVLLVNEADRLVLEDTRRLGAQLVEKPFHGAQLLTAVREALGRQSPD